MCQHLWVCGGQIVTGTVFPHKNLHFPVGVMSKLAHTIHSPTIDAMYEYL